MALILNLQHYKTGEESIPPTFSPSPPSGVIHDTSRFIPYIVVFSYNCKFNLVCLQ